mmetsp:Transcript_9331/g.19251  ORF Transcript_9331/g.19251 Transcript_9331/m.19251 type:complete len:329 (+) Transcript_9331:558-1544(+)
MTGLDVAVEPVEGDGVLEHVVAAAQRAPHALARLVRQGVRPHPPRLHHHAVRAEAVPAPEADGVVQQVQADGALQVLLLHAPARQHLVGDARGEAGGVAALVGPVGVVVGANLVVYFGEASGQGRGVALRGAGASGGLAKRTLRRVGMPSVPLQVRLQGVQFQQNGALLCQRVGVRACARLEVSQEVGASLGSCVIVKLVQELPDCCGGGLNIDAEPERPLRQLGVLQAGLLASPGSLGHPGVQTPNRFGESVSHTRMLLETLLFHQNVFLICLILGEERLQETGQLGEELRSLIFKGLGAGSFRLVRFLMLRRSCATLHEIVKVRVI